jgi:hypothetical protein
MKQQYEVGSEMPKSLGKCADLLAEVRDIRLAMDKEVAAVKKRETEIREHIIRELANSEDTGVSGLRYRAQIVKKTVPTVENWGVFTSWVRENNRFDLIQKRIASKGIEDLWEEREKVPGISRFHNTNLSLKKV